MLSMAVKWAENVQAERAEADHTGEMGQLNTQLNAQLNSTTQQLELAKLQIDHLQLQVDYRSRRGLSVIEARSGPSVMPHAPPPASSRPTRTFLEFPPPLNMPIRMALEFQSLKVSNIPSPKVPGFKFRIIQIIKFPKFQQLGLGH